MRRILGDVYQNQISRSSIPRGSVQRFGSVCLLCQQRARRSIAPFSSTTRQRLRKRPVIGSANSRGTTRPSQEREVAGSIKDAENELVLGGERTSQQIYEDMREYRREETRREQMAFQQSVNGATDEHYIKATNWDGMEMVGGEKEWAHGPHKPFEGFIPATRITNPRQIKLAIHQATIETYLAQHFRTPPRKLSLVDQDDVVGGQAELVEMMPSSDGSSIDLRFPNEALRKSIFDHFTRQDTDRRNSVDTAEHAQAEPAIDLEASKKGMENFSTPAGAKPLWTPAELPLEEGAEPESTLPSAVTTVEGSQATQIAVSIDESQTSPRAPTFDKQWGTVPISHPAVKLAVIRRVTQLTGHVFPDHVIQSASTIWVLSQYLIKALQKPSTLYEALVGPAPAAESKGLLEELLDSDSMTEVRGNPSLNLAFMPGQKKGPLTGLPNVVVSGRRVSPVDKEKAMGRWKTIEAELEKRRLPVIGRD